MKFVLVQIPIQTFVKYQGNKMKLTIQAEQLVKILLLQAIRILRDTGSIYRKCSITHLFLMAEIVKPRITTTRSDYP